MLLAEQPPCATRVVSHQLLPPLLETAALDPDFSISRVEDADGDDDDDYEVSYTPEPSGRGLIRFLRITAQRANPRGFYDVTSAYFAHSAFGRMCRHRR